MRKKALPIMIGSAAVVLIAVVLSILGFTGAFTSRNRELRITEIEGYEKPAVRATAIEVVWGEEYKVQLTIYDTAQIQKIQDFLLQRRYTKWERGAMPPPGSTNWFLTLVFEDGFQVGVGTFLLTDQNRDNDSPAQRDELESYVIGIVESMGGNVFH